MPMCEMQRQLRANFKKYIPIQELANEYGDIVNLGPAACGIRFCPWSTGDRNVHWEKRVFIRNRPEIQTFLEFVDEEGVCSAQKPDVIKG